MGVFAENALVDVNRCRLGFFRAGRVGTLWSGASGCHQMGRFEVGIAILLPTPLL